MTVVNNFCEGWKGFNQAALEVTLDHPNAFAGFQAVSVIANLAGAYRYGHPEKFMLAQMVSTLGVYLSSAVQSSICDGSDVKFEGILFDSMIKEVPHTWSKWVENTANYAYEGAAYVQDTSKQVYHWVSEHPATITTTLVAGSAIAGSLALRYLSDLDFHAFTSVGV